MYKDPVMAVGGKPGFERGSAGFRCQEAIDFGLSRAGREPPVGKDQRSTHEAGVVSRESSALRRI